MNAVAYLLICLTGLTGVLMALIPTEAVMVLLVGYLFLTAEVRVTGVEVMGVSAAQDPAAFEALKNAVEEETFQGTLYQSRWNGRTLRSMST